MRLLLLTLAVAGAAFFVVRGIQQRVAYKRMSQLDRTRAELEEAQSREEKLSLKQRLLAALHKRGYEGDLFPFTAAVAFLYLALVVTLRVIGVGYTIAGLVALPAAAVVTIVGAGLLSRRRRRRFNQQLIDLLDLLAGQIEAGNGAQKALQIVVPNMQEPLRGEMNRVLNAQMASKDLIGSMQALSQRYPSRAMSMFVSALEIDQAEGQAIGPALRQASELLKRDFALASEANAEISQTRGEFLAVVAIVGGISAQMILNAGEAASKTWASPLGLVALALGLANVGLGVWRFFHLLNKARGDT